MIFASFPRHSQSAREELQLTATSARLGLRILFAVILAFQGGVLFAQCDSGSDSGSGSGSSAVADLDAYSGAAAAYSVRLVYSTYAGSAFEVRRGSDNQTQDIGFDSNGALDTGALESFCSGTDCFVTTWYDQSGNGKDATQTSPSSQPQIYGSADGVVLENARPALLFDGDDYLTSENVLSGTTNRSLFSVHRRDGDQGSWTALYAPGTASPNGTGMLFAGFKEKMGAHVRNGKEQVNYTAGYQYLMSFTLGEANITSSQFHVNGIELPASSQLSLGVNTTSTDSHIGGSWRSNPSTKAWKGSQQELLFYASDEASNREAIEENMNAYFRVIPSYNEGVPFQDNPFILNPSVTAETSGSNPTLYMTTFESQLLSMIKELEDAIAAANGTEPNYGQYTEAVDLGGGVMAMNYNVLDLRDAVVSLQVELDEAMAATVVNTDSAADVAQEYAKLRGSVTSNVQPLQDWGFVFDTDEAFATSDTIDVPFTAEQITEFATSESDTGSFYLEQSALDPSTTYYFKAYATDCEEVVYGSSVSFTTLAAATTIDVVEDKTDSTGTLQASFVYGNAVPTAVGFQWGLEADLSDATSNEVTMGADSTIQLALTGLQKDSTYYYTSYATNAGGTAYGDTLSFVARGFVCESPTYDGYDYDVVVIGDQCWFAENLQTTLYADGSEISEVTDDTAWGALTSGARCDYDNDASNVESYGRLYNWYAVDDSRGLCPSGWHVASDPEFTVLAEFLGGSSIAGEKLKSSATDTSAWDGTNSSGWSGLPGGMRFGGNLNGAFEYVGSFAAWWASSSDTTSVESAWHWYMDPGETYIDRDGYGNSAGFSVRCLRDSASVPVVSSAAASAATDTTATLNGSVDFNWESISAAGFKWGYAADLSDATDVAGDTLVGDFTADLTGLVTNETLYFVAYATNALGTTYGDTLSFEVSTPACEDLTSVTFDGHDYELVSIGDQCWFAENLQTTVYADGSAIPEVTDDTAWAELTSDAQCVHGNESSNLETYGRLYNWYAVDDSRGLCPAGWHVASDAEFTELSDFLGGSEVAGDKLKSSATDTPAWDGTNSSGWSGLPGAFRFGPHTDLGYGAFADFLGSVGHWWTSTRGDWDNDPTYAWDRFIYVDAQSLARDASPHSYGYSVRCLLDSVSVPVVITSGASPVTDSTATLNASAYFNWEPISATGFKWGYAADLSDATDVAGDTLVGAFTIDLTGLATNDSLYFVAYATNALGTTYGDTLSFKVTGPCVSQNSYTFDGYEYDLVEIGDQCWFAENLQTTVYADGSAIPEVTDDIAWAELTSDAQCVHGNESSNLETYGRLYNWYAVDDSRGLCPAGWHVASHAEFTELGDFLGGSEVAGDKLKSSATDTPAWDGTNSSGWSGLPGAYRSIDHPELLPGSFAPFLGSSGSWWTSTRGDWDPTYAWQVVLYGEDVLYVDAQRLKLDASIHSHGYSVRCLRDSESAPVVSSAAASDVTETTATLNGSADYNHWHPLSATGFKWGYAADLSDATDAAGDTLAGDFTVDLTGLVTYDTLYFVAYATNALGTTYGDTLSFEVRTHACEDLTSVTFDGHDYDLVSIGDQCWFAENLQTTVYADGSAIPEVNAEFEFNPEYQVFSPLWGLLTSGARCSYDNDSNNVDTYGLLYNWYAVDDPRGLCPSGWHVPTDAEWDTLRTELGGIYIAGDKMKSSASDSPSWDGTNSSGWSGLPGGNRYPGGTFSNIGSKGTWWSSSTPIGADAWCWNLYAGATNFGRDGEVRRSGFSVRCLRDSASVPVVSSAAASAVTDTTATLNGSVDFNWELSTATGFKWGYAADLSDATDVAGDTLAGDFTAELTDLVTNNTLYFVAYATNALGTTYGDTLSVIVTGPCEGLNSYTFDGYEYDLVEIGDQCWFAENLQTTLYADGSEISEVTDDTAWGALTSGARCDYENDASNVESYGRLYNWYAVDDSRGLCPSGWHVASDPEFTVLAEFLGGSSIAGEKLKSSATDTPAWDGTNSSGWSGLPGGMRFGGNYGGDYNGAFDMVGSFAAWWTSSSDTTSVESAWHWYMDSGETYIDRLGYNNGAGFSVRCLRDSAMVPVASTSAASAVTDTTATLNGSVVYNWDPISVTGFKWGYAADLSDATDVPGDTLAGDFTVDLTGLVTNETLYFVAYATNALGTTYGDTLSFEVRTPACEDLTSVTFDGYDYDLVSIGDQCWFAENLQTTLYADGSEISEVTDDTAWGALTSGARCDYDNDASNVESYGRLYNWYAVDDSRGLCPSGWHVASDPEFTVLAEFLGGSSIAGEKLKSSATDTPAWDGTNSSGWSGLPGGLRFGGNYNGAFEMVGSLAAWWTSSSDTTSIESAWYWFMDPGETYIDRYGYGNSVGFSVRCLRDSSSVPVVSSAAASAVTDTTATLNGSVDFNWESISAAGFKWGYAADLSDATDVAGDTLVGAFTIDLTGLATNDSLYYVAYATNSLGTTYGDTLGIDVRTPACEDLTSVTFDGYEYDLVSIGDQCWFAENLRSSVYADGSAIQEVTDNAAWLALTTGARSDYNNESDSAAIYGRLYNWYAVDDSRGFCPTGWHVPTDEEFTTLTDFLGGSAVAGEKMKSAATDTPSWNGTNVSGWSGLPGGRRNWNGLFDSEGDIGTWWSSSIDGGYPMKLTLNNSSGLSTSISEVGYSVRCLRDSASAPVASTSASTDVTITTATLNGTVDFNWESISATGFKWGYAADLSDATDVAGDTLVGDFTTDLTDLVTDDSLYFAAYATNALGTTYGDTLSFKVTGPCASLNSYTFDGYDYDIVPIGDQCWFAENLRSENYNDGSPIPYETADNLWANLTTGARAVYEHDGSSFETYGGLYNWAAVDDPRGLCPTGWHVPTEAEFTALMDLLGGPSGSTASDALKSSEGWVNWNGTNSSGWSGLPGGRRNWDGSFDVEGYIGNWWSSSEQMCNISQGCATYLNVNNAHNIGDGGQRNGYSVRCLRDSGLPVANTVEASAVTDTTATLNGSTDFNPWESISATGFKWGYTADLSDATDVAGDALVDGFTADLTNLVMNNTLYFVAYATNGLGTTYGDTLSFEVKNPPCEDFTSVTFDGYDYDVVSIGDQCWFAENLRSENYNDGSPIPYETADNLWANLTTGARAVYDHQGWAWETYGGLYNWYAVDDSRGLCPTGWHVPSHNEFTVLAESFGGSSIAGPELKSSATDTPAWNGTNSSGWSGLPGGSRDEEGSFGSEGDYGRWWSATQQNQEENAVWRRHMRGWSDSFSEGSYDARQGYSVRCLRDNLSPVVSTVTESSVTDSTATLNGSVDFNYWYPISATGFKWGYTADLSDATIVAGDALLGSFSVDLTSPVTGNVVYFTAFATNDRGTSYGDTLSFEVKNPACGSLTSLTFDGYDYDVVSVGDQCWFAENLRSENYNDGSPIPYETANDLWENLTTGARAVYEHQSWTWESFGGMYNWYAVNDSRGLCPTGWHVPTDTDFSTMVNFLGNYLIAGDKMKSSASDSPAWDGTNSSDWSGLPGGRRQWNGLFTQVNEAGYWWSASLDDWDDSKSYYRNLDNDSDQVERSSMEHSVGLSVRCLRDSESPVVSTAEATALTDTTATLNGSVDLNHWYPISATGFKWGYAADLSDATDVVGDALIGDFTADLTDLVTGNTVYFTAFATNALETAYGDTLSFEVQGPACGDLTSLTFDGYDYDVVSVGDQCWFAENLRSENYNDGSPIPYETANDLWANLTTGARAVYNHESWAWDAYGGMYNWYAVNDARGLCPTGWHVPTNSEHETLRNFLSYNSNSVKSSATDSPSWNGTNASGWSGLPGGQRAANGGFYLEGETANFWSSDGGATHAYAMVLKTETTVFQTYTFEHNRGLSVRCLKDAD